MGNEMESPLIVGVFHDRRWLICHGNSFVRRTIRTHKPGFATHCFPSHKKFKPNSSVLGLRRPYYIDSARCDRQRTHGVDESIFNHVSKDYQNLFLDDICGWLSRLCNFSRRWASGIITFYLFILTLGVDAHGDPTFLLSHACDDVANYYASVEHKEGEALMKELNSIISTHHSLSYKEVWEALKILDAADVDNPEASSDVVEIYSLRVVPKLLAGKPEGWNREHLWPRSYGLKVGPSLTDLHNIRPADVNVNSSRGNKYFGECLANSTVCLKPANKEAAFDTETDKEKWAPPLEVRGDVARALMYMAVCYGLNQPDGSPNLHLSDSPSVENREMGLLSTLLKWNELDPPSRAEQLRNNRICQLYQHNRNPFIDHPEYANLIWKRAIPGRQAMSVPSLESWINEFHYNNNGRDQNEFVEIVVGPSTDAARLKLALYNGSNGKIYRSLSLDSSSFDIKDGGSGFLIYTTYVQLQNGPGDGIALVSYEEDGHVQVIQFISYEGVMKAADGPAQGAVSKDIGLQETEWSSNSDSLGLTGRRIMEFKWRKFINEAPPGKPNMGQVLSNS